MYNLNEIVRQAVTPRKFWESDGSEPEWRGSKGVFELTDLLAQVLPAK